VKILIADDDPVSRRLLEGTLARLGHEIIAVSDGPDAVIALQQADGPKLAILDWMMPGADGLEVCRALRALSGPYVYLILLTARDARADMIEALDSGADDFIIKPFDAMELRARIRSGARVLQLQENLLKAQEALRVEAARDSLTGLWNRGMILEQLRREIRRARHEKRPLAVLLADIDHFKRVNDTYGHAAGDEVIQQAANRMRLAVRDYDFIGRYGGEEFLVVLPGCDRDLATLVAERLRQRVGCEPVHAGNVTLDVTVSVGLAWTASCDEVPAALVAAADTALYRAKGQGRDRVAA
jgi:diguanylate cyclase (GGDEF)-like protein